MLTVAFSLAEVQASAEIKCFDLWFLARFICKCLHSYETVKKLETECTWIQMCLFNLIARMCICCVFVRAEMRRGTERSEVRLNRKLPSWPLKCFNFQRWWYITTMWLSGITWVAVEVALIREVLDPRWSLPHCHSNANSCGNQGAGPWVFLFPACADNNGIKSVEEVLLHVNISNKLYIWSHHTGRKSYCSEEDHHGFYYYNKLTSLYVYIGYWSAVVTQECCILCVWNGVIGGLLS